ncbi:MAG: hypothetical protein IPG76_04105 [Acidobacteria bacterium]|nr:hypothetical protein [Acidobacteriota bacterium]
MRWAVKRLSGGLKTWPRLSSPSSSVSRNPSTDTACSCLASPESKTSRLFALAFSASTATQGTGLTSRSHTRAIREHLETAPITSRAWRTGQS